VTFFQHLDGSNHHLLRLGQHPHDHDDDDDDDDDDDVIVSA
jgi:hypothetical protein